MMRSDFARTTAIADELLVMAEEEQDPLLLSEAHLLVGLSRGWRGDLPASLEQLDQALGYCESTCSGYVDFRVGPHPGVVTNVVTALTQWMVGRPEEAVATMQRGLDLAASLDHPSSRAYALHHAGLLDLWRQDLAGVSARADELLAIADAHDYPTWHALALVFRGMAMVGSGEVDEGLTHVDEGFRQYKGLSAPPVFWPALLMIRASALGAAGRAEEALAMIQEADAGLRAEDPLAADVCIAHGEVLLLQSPPEVAAAEAAFERAAAHAGGRGARMMQLQALTRLAELRRGTPGEAEARRALQEVYVTFTEGLDTPQLVAARAALGS
jgi:hypothetical protein